jgi:hypothetical protein
MTRKTYTLLVAWDDEQGNCVASKFFTFPAISAEAAFAEICEAYAERPRLVFQREESR